MPRLGAPRKDLKFARVQTPGMASRCIVCVSHKPDDKGYIRVVPRVPGKDRARPLHRLAYLSKHGPASIPEGWEVDHICGNRACANRKHLRAIDLSDHKRITAAARYAERLEAAYVDWLAHGLTAQELADKYGVKVKTAQGWITRWKVGPPD